MQRVGGLEVAAAWAGIGSRSWPSFSHEAASNEAVMLPRRAVRDRVVLRLDSSLDATGRAHSLLAQMDDLLAGGQALAGFLGYEFGLALEGLPFPQHMDESSLRPDVDLLIFDPRDLENVSLPGLSQPSGLAASKELEKLGPSPADLRRQQGPWMDAVASALKAIRAGSLYQVNLSVQFSVPAPAGLAEAPLLPVLAAALQTQPVPYAMVYEGEGQRLLSGSMERYLALHGDRVSSRPIKGTAPRGHGVADERARERLLASAKERAENTMIVDMVRNDLSRVCVPGSVTVPELLACEPYTTLWHLESEVHGRLQAGARLGDLLHATMPPSSVTGCPKVAAMRFIARAERRRRGAYCGALGVALSGRRADWSVGIRQMSVAQGMVRMSVGSGIVADSVADEEWRETCLKAAGGLAWLERLAKGVTRPRQTATRAMGRP